MHRLEPFGITESETWANEQKCFITARHPEPQDTDTSNFERLSLTSSYTHYGRSIVYRCQVSYRDRGNMTILLLQLTYSAVLVDKQPHKSCGTPRLKPDKPSVDSLQRSYSIVA